MYAEISAAIQSVKTVGELAKAATSLSNYNELIAAVSEVNSKLMEATAVALASQERQSELLNRIAHLEKELGEVRAEQKRAERYSLFKFATGSLAYQLKTEFEAEEPPHFLCAKCADSGGHTKLQPWGSRRLKCFSCESVIQTEPDPPAQPRSLISRTRI
ncbi:hypothetical protein [Ramlibacter sp. AN1133]|uniref:hypothetical protein n=1 Tax=Ramlibacter sp. AN1133 TaxID=3133429 RepID=UPI0030C3DEA1